MGRGTSKAGGGSNGGGGDKGENMRLAGWNAADRAFIKELANDMAFGDLYNSDMQAAVESYGAGRNGFDDNAMTGAVRQEVAVLRFGGDTTPGASLSGKPFDPKDYTTWPVGANVTYKADDGVFGSYTYTGGKVISLNPGKEKNTVMVHVDGLTIYVTPENQKQFKVTK